jgi:hypothetical protein
MPIQITDELPGERRPYLGDVVSSFSRGVRVGEYMNVREEEKF